MTTVAQHGPTGQARHRADLAHALLTSFAAVGWALLGMTGVAALGLHLLGADAAGSLGAITAATVALAVGGKVVPSGDLDAFGLKGAQAEAALNVMPLGVSLTGALLLALVFLRGLRSARAAGPGGTLGRGELALRTGTVAALFTAAAGGLAWAGHSQVTLDGGALGLDKAGGAVQDRVKDELGGGLGDIGGGLLDRIDGLAKAKAHIGFTVELLPTLLGAACWVLAVLLIALAASRFTPLPAGRLWDAAQRVVRPAVSSLVLVLLLVVGAGLAAGVYGALAGGDPRRAAGAALLGAPNGAWLAVPVGLFVGWRGTAHGELATLLPDPFDELLGGADGDRMTVRDLAALDGRVWLLPVAVGLALLAAGALTAARTPRRGAGAWAFSARCGARLGVATGLALPLLVTLTDVSADAGLSVLGVDAVDAGIELRGDALEALVLGAAWGMVAGCAGGLLACATGAAGRRATGAALGRSGASGTYDASRTYPSIAYERGPYQPSAPPDTTGEPGANPYKTGPGARPDPGPWAAPPQDPYAGDPGAPSPGAPSPGDPHSGPTVGDGLPRPRRRPEPPPPGPPPPQPGGRPPR